MITATSPRSCTHARTVKLNSRFLVQLEDFCGNCVMSQRGREEVTVEWKKTVCSEAGTIKVAAL